MNQQQLTAQINAKRSFLCTGLDTDITKIPKHLLSAPDPVFAFNKAIINATAEYSVAYKPNIAFYESLGWQGWQSLEKTVKYVKEKYPEIFMIADAKRGDIGNTSAMYARAFFEKLDFDAVTVAPYMGEDSVKPFMNYPGKWVILLALTSNTGAANFQFIRNNTGGDMLYETVLKTSRSWGTAGNTMYVVGATKAESLKQIREIIPEHFILVPGIGAQGGSLSEVARNGLNAGCGLLVNSSRSIIYASPEADFAEKAREAAREIQQEMEQLLETNN